MGYAVLEKGPLVKQSRKWGMQFWKSDPLLNNLENGVCSYGIEATCKTDHLIHYFFLFLEWIFLPSTQLCKMIDLTLD